MVFKKIKASTDGVELSWTEKRNNADVDSHLDEPARPMPTFLAAMAALKPYVVATLGLPEAWTDGLRVSSISIDEKTGTGLCVCAIYPIEKCAGRPLVLNVPRMTKPSDERPNAADAYPADLDQLLDEIEAEAVRYIKGEREQMDAFASATASGDSDIDTARKEKANRAGKGGKKAPKSIEGVQVVGGGTSDDDALREKILAAGRDVPIDAIERWTSTERDSAVRWVNEEARVRQGLLSAKAVKIPKCIEKDGTLALLTEHAAKVEAAGRAD